MTGWMLPWSISTPCSPLPSPLGIHSASCGLSRNIIQITQVISHFINKHSPNFPTCMTNCGSGFALLADADALHQAQSELTHWFQEHRLTAGVGSSGNTLAALRRSYDQARHSLKFAIQAGNYGLAQFSDYQLNYLMSLIPADQAAALLNAGPLSMIETCDQQNGTELLKTVRAYLRCGEHESRCRSALCP